MSEAGIKIVTGTVIGTVIKTETEIGIGAETVIETETEIGIGIGTEFVVGVKSTDVAVEVEVLKTVFQCWTRKLLPTLKNSFTSNSSQVDLENLPPEMKVSIQDILRDNPGISMPDAIQKLHNVNVAIASSSGELSESALARSQNAIANINATTGIPGVGGAGTKPFREVYIGNLPPGVTVPQLIDFLNVAMKYFSK